MPAIKSVQFLIDVATGNQYAVLTDDQAASLTFKFEDIPAGQRTTTTRIENFINTALQNRAGGKYNGAIHVFQAPAPATPSGPFRFTLIFMEPGDVIPPDWWVE